MKKITIILSIIFIQFKCAAQTQLIPGEVKGEHYTFFVEPLQQLAGDTQKRIIVYNTSNKYVKGIPNPKLKGYPINPKKDMHVNEDTIKVIIYSVLKKKLKALKNNKEYINILIDFKTDETLSDITYSLKANTIISIKDIEDLEKRLKSAVKVKFTGKQYLQYIAVTYYSPDIIF